MWKESRNTIRTVRIGWDDHLPRTDRDWTQSRNDAVHRSIRRSPRERPQLCRSENRGSGGPQSGRGAPPEEEGKDPWNSGSRGKLAAACRKVSRLTKVIRNIRIQGSRELRKELAVARREMMHRAIVARRSGHDRKRQCSTENSKGQTSGMRRWKGPECNNGMRDRDLKQQLWGNERINNSGIRRLLRLKIERTSEELDRKAFGLDFIKRAIGISIVIESNKDWTLLRGWPPPKLKKKQQTAHGVGADNVEAPALTTTERIDRTSSVARDERT
jgi:hypothetical protein